MQRTGVDSAVTDKHGSGKNGYTNGDPGVEQPTVFDADMADALQEEIARAIENEGDALDPTVYTQLSLQFQRMRMRDRLTRLGNIYKRDTDTVPFAVHGVAGAGTDGVDFSTVSVGKQSGANTDNSQINSTEVAFDGSNNLLPNDVASNGTDTLVACGFDFTTSDAFIQKYVAGWTTPTVTGLSAVNAAARRVRYIGGLFVVLAGDKVFYSEDGDAWASATPATGVVLTEIAYHPVTEKFVVATDPEGSGAWPSGLLESDDGCATWTRTLADGTAPDTGGIGHFTRGMDWGYDALGNVVLGFMSLDGDMLRTAYTTGAIFAPASWTTVLDDVFSAGSNGGHLLHHRGMWFLSAVGETDSALVWPMYGALRENVWTRALPGAVDLAAKGRMSRWAVQDNVPFFALHDDDNEGEIYSFPRLCAVDVTDPTPYP